MARTQPTDSHLPRRQVRGAPCACPAGQWPPAKPVLRYACFGTSDTEIDALIDNGRHSTISREESICLWEQTYEGQENAAELMELCRDCVEAIADAGFSGR